MTPASVTGLRIRPAEPAEYDDVRALLLEAYCSRFWITGAYRESLLDIEGHLADGEELLVAEAGAGGADGAAGGAEGIPGAAGAGGAERAGAGRGPLLGAVFVPVDTGRGPDGVVEQSFGRL